MQPSAMQTSYIKVTSYGYEEDGAPVPLENGIDSKYKSVGKFIVEQDPATQETILTPGYFFYLAKNPKIEDAKYGTGGAVKVKLIDNTVSDVKIRSLVEANRIVVCFGGAGSNLQVHRSRANEFNNYFVNEENTNYKWVVIKTEKGKNNSAMLFSILNFQSADTNDYNKAMSDLLRFRNITKGTQVLPIVTTLSSTVVVSSSTSSSKKGKEKDSCIIS